MFKPCLGPLTSQGLPSVLAGLGFWPSSDSSLLHQVMIIVNGKLVIRLVRRCSFLNVLILKLLFVLLFYLVKLKMVSLIYCIVSEINILIKFR